jgi:hypothetical protein
MTGARPGKQDEMARGLHGLGTGTPGRHTRRPDLGEVRRASLTMLIMLVVQYGLGIFLNLYVAVPASDQHAGIMQEIAAGPFALTVHALLGLSLIVTAIVLLARALRTEERALLVLATVALGAIAGAFAAGEVFVRDGGHTSASFLMAILTGLALLCYIATLVLASVSRRDLEFERDLADDDPDDFTPWTPSGPPRTSLIYTDDQWTG